MGLQVPFRLSLCLDKMSCGKRSLRMLQGEERLLVRRKLRRIRHSRRKEPIVRNIAVNYCK
jgi:hypothetical protein